MWVSNGNGFMEHDTRIMRQGIGLLNVPKTQVVWPCQRKSMYQWERTTRVHFKREKICTNYVFVCFIDYVYD